MSRIHKEHLQAGYKEDLTLDEACRIIDRYTLKPCKHPSLGKRSF